MSDKSTADHDLSQDDINQPRAHFSMIMSTVLDDDQLDNSSKILFARITSLTFQEGYCFGSNSYLAKLQNVDERSIRRQLEKLEERGHVTKKFVDIGGRLERRITTHTKYHPKTEAHKKESEETECPGGEDVGRPGGRTNMSGGGGHECPGGRTQMSGDIYKPNYIRRKVSVTDESVAPQSGAFSEASPQESRASEAQESNDLSYKAITIETVGGKKTITDTDLFRYVVGSKRSWSSDEISYAWNALSSYGGFVGDWNRFIEGTITNFQKKKKSKRISDSKSGDPDKTQNRRSNGKCKKTIKETSDTDKNSFSGKGTAVHPSETCETLMDLAMKYRNGSMNQKTF